MTKQTSWRRSICLVLAVVFMFSVSASAAPGQTSDPVITLDYLEEKFLPKLVTKAKDKAKNDGAALTAQLDELLAVLDGLQNGTGSNAPIVASAVARKVLKTTRLYAPSPITITLTENTTVTLWQGASAFILSGKGILGAKSALDTTVAAEAEPHRTIPANHKLVALENGTTLYASEDKTRIVLSGYYSLDLPPIIQYTDICQALIDMEIIDTWKLDRYATRLEMFVVILAISGLRQPALNYQGGHPFTDLNWGDGYVAYLYDNKYTKGTGLTTFSPNSRASAQQMCALLMRILGYIEDADFTYNNALQDAVRLGLFSGAEMEILTADGFYRDQMMYMGYYALTMRFKNSSITVLDRLVASGHITNEKAENLMAKVARIRP